MIYDYVADDGTRIEVERPMTNPPPSILKRLGKVFYRDWSSMRTTAPTRPSKRDRHFESRVLPRWHPDAPAHGPDGKPRFDGQRDVDEFVAKARDREGMDIRYNDGE